MKIETVYIVSGYMRSGTSMMMKALEKGGMTARYNTAKDRILSDKYEHPDYHPNPEGFYELGTKEFESEDFPTMYQGQLIKALHWRLKDLPLFCYKVVFMLRDPREIEVSYLKMFRQRPPFVLQTYHEFIEKTLSGLSKRGDMDITSVWHNDMIQTPHQVLGILKQNGFPITNIKSGAESVNPDLYRSKGKDLDRVRKSIPGLRTDLPDCLNKS
ncbi:MAG: hypothetical protein KKD44_08210 [Proteobacteria bacterium]|nr:hypothetical protein [Pseudomonadota bacterium]